MRKLPVSLLLLGCLLFVGGHLALALDLPRSAGYVNDFANLLSADFEEEIEQDLFDFEKETSAEVAIVTVDDLQGTTVEDFAVRLFEAWGIGQKDKDNGLLILIARSEQKIRLEVGYGLEPVITDARAGDIIRQQMAPDFKIGNYEQGIKNALSVLKSYIGGEEPPPTAASISTPPGLALIFILIIFGGIFLLPTALFFYHFLGRTKSVWAGSLLGGGFGAILGLLAKSSTVALVGAVTFGAIGLIVDWFFSRHYKPVKKWLKANKGRWWIPSSLGRSGGFYRGGGSRSSGGSFGGGSSGGGGASGGW